MDSTFSQRLREAITAKGLTQEALARETDVTLRTVQSWCLGEKEPKGRQLVAMASVLDRHPGWFFEVEKEAA